MVLLKDKIYVVVELNVPTQGWVPEEIQLLNTSDTADRLLGDGVSGFPGFLVGCMHHDTTRGRIFQYSQVHV